MRRKSVRDRGVPGGRKDSFSFSGKSQTDTYHILYSEVRGFFHRKIRCAAKVEMWISRTNFGGPTGSQAERTPYSSCFPHLHQTEGVRLGKHRSTQSTCRGTRDLIVRRSRLCGGRGGGGQRGESTGHQQHFVLTYRYQVERCAGPVEGLRATE